MITTANASIECDAGYFYTIGIKDEEITLMDNGNIGQSCLFS